MLAALDFGALLRLGVPWLRPDWHVFPPLRDTKPDAFFRVIICLNSSLLQPGTWNDNVETKQCYALFFLKTQPKQVWISRLCSFPRASP